MQFKQISWAKHIGSLNFSIPHQQHQTNLVLEIWQHVSDYKEVNVISENTLCLFQNLSLHQKIQEMLLGNSYKDTYANRTTTQLPSIAIGHRVRTL